MEGRGRGFSLWLVPGGDSLERLTALIAGLAARLGTPSFLPHITLIPGLVGDEAALADRTEASAGRLSAPRVQLGPLEATDEYFRCLYLKAEPAAALRALHLRAAEAFEVRPDPAFLPHLSLVYGHLEADQRRRITAALEADPPRAFEAVSLELWRTEGPVPDWASRRRYGLRRDPREDKTPRPVRD